FTDLQKIINEYPSSANKEQVLELFAPTAVETGRSQAAIDALNSYSPTNGKPALLLERAHAYQVAGQGARAAKDYQTVFYKFPLTDEAKAASTSLSYLQKQLHSEFPYGTAEMQEMRAQAFFDNHKWREARTEFEKLVSMLHEASNPVR